MPILKSLTFTSLPARSHDPAAHRRAKLVANLEDQKRLLADPSLRARRPALDRQGRPAKADREAAARAAVVAR